MQLHPVLSSFPLPIFSLAVIFTVLGLSSSESVFRKACARTAPFLAILASTSVLAAYLSGLPAAEALTLHNKIPDDVLASHQSLGKLTLLSCLILLPCAILHLLKCSRGLALIFLLSLVLSLTLSFVTSWRGGILVFEYGAGVHPKVLEHRNENLIIRNTHGAH